MKALDRRALLARVHIARKEMGLDQGAYSALVSRVTGKESAADCANHQLLAVLADMKAHGWKPKLARGISEKPHVRKIWAMWGSMEVLLADPSRQALRTFVQRQTRTERNPVGVSDPDFLNVAEAKKVIHGLEGWRGRLLAARAAETGQEAAHA